MKPIGRCILILLILTSENVFGQNSKTIEADLLTAFKKINYWDTRQADTTVSALDSLDEANSWFERKLLSATAKYPATIGLPFKSFANEPLGIITSTDGLLRLYWWDTLMGGTQHFYTSVAQYTSAQSVKSVTPPSPNEYTCSYSKIYFLKNGGKIYYLAVYDEILDYHQRCQGIQIFSIENGNLIQAKLIKTQTGLHSKIDFQYNENSMRDQDWSNDLKYDEKVHTLTMPVVTESGSVTNNCITYKFNGQYFIKGKRK
ncbi:hypothetical protein [Mucilaginibacter sp. OK283]|jgi:hypothetical protein|uniref:hypothetical protein n=1 Tax=Mucilaginibacter sp. OK283 TaxID=1881049 RepID=UPI0008B77575|nr:hypothetical protein [Mucilaginibacter sp. OK283]SEO11704.1 hypothetical protein SAMN05428947_101362 [Mucilaginibacter sp. OK283]